MSRDAIPVDRLTKSLPFSSQPATAASSTASCKDTTSSTEMHAIELVGTCTVGSSTTPIRLHLRGYFHCHLESDSSYEDESTCQECGQKYEDDNEDLQDKVRRGYSDGRAILTKWN